ncbi:histidine--tRNA ligase [archaeon]|nr:MAG: histidine--tRNA ligase [archaeon]
MYEKLRGVRDFYPEDHIGRRHMHDALYATARSYGFKEVTTPSIEPLELITKKSGDAIVNEIYAFQDKGGRDICLIPELTPSIARMVISRQKELVKPVKWCSLSRHWRYERPQRGRQREFYQFNVDILGVRSSRADFETIACGIDCMLSLGLDNFRFHISDRTLIEQFFTSHGIDASQAFSIVDKRTKVNEGEFRDMLSGIGVGDECYEQLEGLLSLNGPIHETLPEVKETLGACGAHADDALTTLEEIGSLLESYGMDEHCTLDLSIVRGLAYYTDMVFEVFDKRRSMRSLFGGGRYDNLIELLGGQPMPAVGFAIGMPLLELLMREEGTWPEPSFGPDYFVVTIGDVEREAFSLIRALRAKTTVEYDLSGKNLSNQMNLANSIGARRVIIVGERDVKSHVFTVKDMETGDQQQVPMDEFYKTLKE